VKGMFIDFETTDSYSFEVKITDTGVPSLSAKSTVRITVEDINENPVLDHKKCNVGYRQCLSILENSRPNNRKRPRAGRFLCKDASSSGF
jgi:hypothetical protein